MKEKRHFTRIEKQFLVSYDIFSKDDLIKEKGIAKELDLSIGGLHLQIPGDPQVGDNLRLTLAIEHQLIQVAGKIVWVEPGEDLNEVGFQLTEIPDEYRDVIADWLE